MKTQETTFDAAETVNSISGAIKKAIRSVGLVPRANDISLLVEAYRRKMFFHRDSPLETAWVGSGYNSMYGKSPFFLPVDGKTPEPRICWWWHLSPIGAKVMQAVFDTVPMPERYSKDEQDLNSQLFKF